jgi:site-specific DNA-cytosine methylase
MKKNKFKFIDLFAGIGGFHTAMHSVGGKCVFVSEWDKYARISYEANYKEISPSLFKKKNLVNIYILMRISQKQILFKFQILTFAVQDSLANLFLSQV